MSSRIHNRGRTTMLRAALLLIAGVALASCSSESDTDLSTMIDIGRNLIDPETSSVSLQQAAAINYATMGFRIGDGSQAMGILTTGTGDQLWVVGTVASFVTRDGRLVRTAGLERNLDRLALEPGSNFSLTAIANGQPADTTWTADFQEKDVFSAPVNCHAQAAGPEDVTILGKVIHTVRVDEECHSDLLKWSFRNTYWVSPASGLVWRSIQHIHPHMDAITVEVFRPASGAVR